MFHPCLLNEEKTRTVISERPASNVRLSIGSLIEALRTELTDYGGMLVLLEEQRDLIEMRAAAALMENVASLKLQMEVVATDRRLRNEKVNLLCGAIDVRAGVSFKELIPCLPREYQPLLGALVDEINDLLFRCQQRVLLNNLLLTSGSSRFSPATLELLPADCVGA